MMKRSFTLAAALVAVALLGANLISQNAALLSAALSELKLESVPGSPGLVGAPPKFKVTKKTIGYLEKLQKDGTIVEVQNNGALKIVESKK